MKKNSFPDFSQVGGGVFKPICSIFTGIVWKVAITKVRPLFIVFFYKEIPNSKQLFEHCLKNAILIHLFSKKVYFDNFRRVGWEYLGYLCCRHSLSDSGGNVVSSACHVGIFGVGGLRKLMQCRKHTQTADYGRIHEGEKT
jgi:hypothetical protein